ncbi:Multidrug resistance protein [Wickerhamomyces ciferrii]|uniref:Multidrug resistance protein n=1 Tax=Wickerhamomyces ciferrii (strain ATCC 14091 / BCRC 22168 / CBS 111 / JCM 3599 / NBRC 0793 / NRRL Y-1031 F-60-10) TaxID=1206466 RepID=K0KS73_WICCF|nr:Multidrug resistance protein [Wickerhamomyces ciferrii]CCH44184.1 Multidrug resistance protein [Wickerhamomyces ciferrii]
MAQLPVVGTYGTEEPDTPDIFQTGNDELNPLIDRTHKIVETTYKNEFQILGKSTLPLVLTTMLQYSMNTISVLVVGHIGEKELAAVSLANVTFVLASSTFIGMSTCLDTLCPQAFGARKYHLVGVYLQRCIAICFLIAIPLLIIFYNINMILKHLVPEHVIGELAQSYLRTISVGLPGYILFENSKRFLQAQGNFHGGQYVLFVCAPLNIMFNFLFVFKFGFGLKGSAFAVALNYWLMAIMLFLYVAFIDGKKCWNGFQFGEITKGWSEMLKLALPGIIMIQAEFFAFQVITLSCSFFGTTSLAAQSIVSSAASLAFQIPFSTTIAASTRIGNLIGSNSGSDAKFAVDVTLLSSLITGSFNFLVLFFLRHQIANIFTSDPVVAAKAASVFIVVAFNQFPDCLNVHAAGCLRAQGRQKIGGYLNLFSYYIVSLPLAMLFAFKFELEVKGLWEGLMCGVIALSGLSYHFIRQSDWEQILIKSRERHGITV